MRELTGYKSSEIAESFKVSEVLFEVIAQNDFEFSIRITRPGFEPRWMCTPAGRFETLSGARYAILLYLEAL